jgi:hypothetical protein
MRATIALIAFFAGACITVPASLDRDAIEGELLIRDPAGDETRFVPDICSSGERELFRGFDLGASDDKSIRLRAVVDPIDGPVVRIDDADREAGPLVLRPDICRLLEISVEPTGWRINEYREVGGRVAFNCALSDGTIARADVEVRGCY